MFNLDFVQFNHYATSSYHEKLQPSSCEKTVISRDIEFTTKTNFSEVKKLEHKLSISYLVSFQEILGKPKQDPKKIHFSIIFLY